MPGFRAWVRAAAACDCLEAGNCHFSESSLQSLMRKIRLFVACGLILGSACLAAMDFEVPAVQAMAYFPFQDHRQLGKSNWSLSLDSYYSNIYMFNPDHSVIQDMEQFSSVAAVRWGLGAACTVEGYFRLARIQGGVLDKLIEDFHRLSWWPVSGRDQFPRNRVHYRYLDAFDYQRAQWFASHLQLAALVRFWQTGPWQVSGRCGLGVPLSGRAGLSSDKPFYFLGGIGRFAGNQWRVQLGGHAAFFGNPGWLAGAALKKHIWHGELRIDRRGLFGGAQYRTSPFRTTNLRHSAFQLFLGVKLFRRLEIALLEELPPMVTTPDVSLNVRIRLGEND